MECTIWIKKEDYEQLKVEVIDEDGLDVLSDLTDKKNKLTEALISFYGWDSEAWMDNAIDLLMEYGVPYRLTMFDSEYADDCEDAYHPILGLRSVVLDKQGAYRYVSHPAKRLIETGENPFADYYELDPILFHPDIN